MNLSSCKTAVRTPGVSRRQVAAQLLIGTLSDPKSSRLTYSRDEINDGYKASVMGHI